MVSIHAPARGATGKLLICIVQIMRFNPRTREGCDLRKTKLRFNSSVSIHAPARGATKDMGNKRGKGRVSIHAPARGATMHSDQNASNHQVSIHAPARGATFPDKTIRNKKPVSIHAPARGATAPLPSPLNRAFERQNARTSAFWAFFHAVFLKQTVFSLFFSQLPLRGFHWETSVSLRFPFFRFCSFLLSRGAVFQNTSGPSGSMAVLAPTCSSRFFQLAPRK